MTKNYIKISDLIPGTKVEAVYLLVNAQNRPKKDGSSFVTVALRDSTGKISGVMWDNFAPLVNGTIKENDFVEVSGEVLVYNNQLQFRINKIIKVDDCDVDSTFFLPTTSRCVDEMETEFYELIEQIQDADLKFLVQAVFDRPGFMDKFKVAPSAVSMHQAYLGGLLEHTICVVKNALKISDNYPTANKCLLICGGLLHDIGKVIEFTYDKKLAYSDVGRLIGHISIGTSIVEAVLACKSDFPMGKKILVQHMILSHHGFLEYGSPRRPATLEALILHQADLIDAQLSNFVEYTETCSKNGVRWEYSNMFDRQMFGGNNVIDNEQDLLAFHNMMYANGEPLPASDTIFPDAE